MQYRDFGNTGIKISALGFGAMRLPEYEKDGKWYVNEDEAIGMMHGAFDLGVNYVDTAYVYCRGNSEVVVGKALKGYRDRVYVSTKMPTWRVKKQGDYRRFLEEQLQKLDAAYIDFYHFHALNQEKWENIVLKFDLLKEAVKAKDEGLIKHISFSFHDKPEVLKRLIDVGLFESLLCQYNLLDRSNEEAIAYAKEKGVGTVIMGPVGGGRLAAPSHIIEQSVGTDVKSTPEVALRFVLGNQNVDCALSGMSSMEMVQENARVASKEEPLSKEDWDKINAMLEETKRLSDLYCTGCDYCMPCPEGIKIPNVFQLMNYHRVYGLTEYAKNQFARLGENKETGQSPLACIECGVCEPKCPQNIQIRAQLKETLKELGTIE
ncbi:MAG: aldo/keto reductase [Firmicutes bacterium]|nr:aldo/keto reductase [Bacillota bacterium]